MVEGGGGGALSVSEHLDEVNRDGHSKVPEGGGGSEQVGHEGAPAGA